MSDIYIIRTLLTLLLWMFWLVLTPRSLVGRSARTSWDCCRRENGLLAPKSRATCFRALYQRNVATPGTRRVPLLASQWRIRGEGRVVRAPPPSDLRGFLLSPLSIAKPSPGSTKMHFSEPEISIFFFWGRPPNTPSASLLLTSTSKNYPSNYFTFSGKPRWDPPYQKILDPPLPSSQLVWPLAHDSRWELKKTLVKLSSFSFDQAALLMIFLFSSLARIAIGIAFGITCMETAFHSTKKGDSGREDRDLGMVSYCLWRPK